MSRKPGLAFVLALALLLPSVGQATDYYVRISGNDGNPGTSAAASWRTIQHALDTMLAGDTTYVGAGTYDEAVRTVRDGTAAAPIALVADTSGALTGDAGTVTITRSGVDVVSVDHDHQLMRGFRISGGSDGIEADDADGLVLDRIAVISSGDDGIDLDHTDATLTDCTIDGTKSNGLEMTGSGKVSVSGATLISNSGNDGLFSQDVALRVDGATLRDNRSEGIRCQRGSLSVANATIRDNGEDGIECNRLVLSVTDSIISGNDAEGIQLDESGSLTVTGTTVTGNGEIGIETDHVPVDIRDTKVSSSRKAGVSVSDASRGTIRDTTISASGEEGFEFSDSTLDLVGVSIGTSGKQGIRAKKGGALRIFDSTIDASGEEGIESEDVDLTLVRTRVSNSRDMGVRIRDASTGALYSSQVLDSGKHGIELDKVRSATVVNSIVARSGEVGLRLRDRNTSANLWHVNVIDSRKEGIEIKDATVFLTNSIVSGSGKEGLKIEGGKGRKPHKGTKALKGKMTPKRGKPPKPPKGGSVTHSYNVFWNNRGGDFKGTAAGKGEVFADPSYTSATDFHLLAASPAIDVGTDASATTTEDLDGNARPAGAAFDIGAYELAKAPAVDHFVVEHDGFGVYCLAETITITAADAAGLPVDDYTGAITLDTQTGNGTWEAAESNQGGFADATPDDGAASYRFADADDGVAIFSLTYLRGGTPVDVDAFETANPTLRDDDAEGMIAWAPSGFIITASALGNPPPGVINDPIATQTAGSSFLLHLTAFGQTPNDPTCGVIESYTGGRPLSFWASHLDPGTGTIVPTIDGNAIATSEATASAQNVAFSNGQAVVSAKYKDVGRIQIDLKDLTVTEPADGVSGATGGFVVRPDELEITAVRRPDGTLNPAVSVPAGEVFVAAGSPFEVEVRVLDAEGNLTPNFGRETSPERLMIRASTLVAPAGGRNGTSGNGTILNATSFSAITPAGTFRSSTFGWDEVGAIRLQLSVADGSYLGTGDVTGSESGTVGRFIPASFGVALNAPSFETSCAGGGFGYVGQEFPFATGLEPEVIATALNAQGTTTENYAGSWFRLDAASQAGLAFLAASGTLTAAAPNLPSVSELGAGSGRLRFDNGPDLGFLRISPVAAFDAEIELRFDLRDQDGVGPAANPVRFGQAAPSLGIAFSSGKGQRFGHMVFTNAHGSELSPLSMPLGTEFWNGSAFVIHTADTCTPTATAWLGLTPQPGSLATTPSIANNPLFAGDAGLALSAPGVGQTGYVDLLFDLTTATGADMPWLLGDWNGDGGWLESPTGRATFGIFVGQGRVIYVRDAY